MPRGIHLRTRVFLLTGLGASLLIAITIALTIGARSSEREFRELVEVQIAAERALTENARLLSNWQKRWLAIEVGASSSVVTDLTLDLRSIATSVAGRTPSNGLQTLSELDAHVSAASTRWDTLDTAERSLALRQIAEHASAGIHQMTAEARRMGNEAETRLEELSKQTRDTVWVALAIVWIIAITSFAVARRTLDKVVVPLERLVDASRRLKAGESDARAPIGGDREIVTLGLSFNAMADSLTESNRALAERARTDELTGLPNYRAFRETLDDEIQRALRFEYEFGLVIIDVDRFKLYNDSFGHQAGNEALKMVSRLVQTSIRSIDTAARFGGEEIAVILPRVDRDTLVATAERIRTSIEREPAIGDASKITVSLGGALFPSAADSPERLFELADSMLYKAKGSGRNRSEIYSNDRVVRHPGSRKSLRKS